jgi:Asp-tRNA(Asn)/Glu-tRNA(Gln) amidotransferase A subunit family amidase
MAIQGGGMSVRIGRLVRVGSAACIAAGAASLLLAARPALQAQAPGLKAFDVYEKSIVELQDAMRSGTVSSVQLVDGYLARIRAYDQDGPKINALIALNPKAREVAAALDEERRGRGPRGPLHGIPIVVKDNYATADMPTTAGSKALEGFQTGRDAFMVKKLRDAGAVIIGKTNLHELAYGITSVSSIGGQTRNPYDVTRNPGGSSGGTGAAVAASFAAAGMGSDTCGSIRNPSSSNNLVGLRGTAGLSSRDGIVPLSHTQDIGGPLARSVTDLAIMLDATVGADAADATTTASQGRIPKSYFSAMGDSSLQDTRLGVLTALFGTAPEDSEVGGITRGAIDAMRQLGADVVEITIPGFEELLQGTSVIAAEFKFDLMDFLAPFPAAPVKTLAAIIASGKYDPAIDGVIRRAEAVESRDPESYRVALARRDTARAAVLAAMTARGVTALAYPTLRRKPARIGEAQGGSNCQLSPTTGLPAISIPAGFTEDGLPVGLDLLGLPFSEPALLKAAYAYERSVGPRQPPKTTPSLVR